MKRFIALITVMFILLSLAGSALADNIWIDTDTEALQDAEGSIAIQMLKKDYNADRSYIGVDAVIHFSANDKNYELYHVLDTGSGCFILSTFGTEPYPDNTFGGEENAEAMAFKEAENAAKDAYFALKNGDNIWIDTDTEALQDAEGSIAIQMLKKDYNADRSYIGVDAVIHFSANDKNYELYHVLDTGSGCFILSTFGTEPYPDNTFGGEENAEAMAFKEAENAAKDAYFALKNGDLGDE